MVLTKTVPRQFFFFFFASPFSFFWDGIGLVVLVSKHPLNYDHNIKIFLLLAAIASSKQTILGNSGGIRA